MLGCKALIEIKGERLIFNLVARVAPKYEKEKGKVCMCCQ